MKPPTFAAILVSLTLGDAWGDSAMLLASDGAESDFFGVSVALSGTSVLAGANGSSIGESAYQGAAYFFSNLDSATGTADQSVKLVASDGAAYDGFGFSIALSGSAAVAGAPHQDGDRGTVYIFRGLGAQSGTLVENAQLMASDGRGGDLFGKSVGLSGTTAIVAAAYSTVGANVSQGSVYLFRNLDTATGTVSQNAKLTASDGTSADYFGLSIAISGNVAIAGAPLDDIGSHTDRGSAYVFRNLNTASGPVTQNVKLTASDGARDSMFGTAVAISDHHAIVGAQGSSYSGSQGAAYVFRSLDSATGSITQNVRLSPSDAGNGNAFGAAVAISGGNAFVGAPSDRIASNSGQGSAYLFRNLDTANGTLAESLKITASGGAANDSFGTSIAVEGDRFVIGAPGVNQNAGKAYTGTISALTTLDAGESRRTIQGISFISQTDWVIGQTSDANRVTLASGASATVSAPGRRIVIGRNGGSDANTLRIDGAITANELLIGAVGNQGNSLVLGTTGSMSGTTLRLAEASHILLEGDHTAAGAVMARFGTSTLQTWNGNAWETVTNANQQSLISTSYRDGYTTISVGPQEPASHAEAWRLAHFGDAASEPLIAADNADPDHDGVPNLLERAFNLNPLEGATPVVQADIGTGGLPLIRTVAGSGNVFLTIQYVRLKAQTEAGLTYLPQFASEITGDAWAASTSAETVESIDDSWERVTIADPMPSPQLKRFARVRVVSGK